MKVFTVSTFDEKYFSFDINLVALESSKMMVDKTKMSRSEGKCISTYFSSFFLSKIIYEKLKHQKNNL